jgi:hypothetical protein
MEIGYGHVKCMVLVQKPDLLLEVLDIRAMLRGSLSRGMSRSKFKLQYVNVWKALAL